MLEKLSYASFAPLLNSQFQVERSMPGDVFVELIEAHEAPAAPGYEVFSLVFRGPASAFLPQAMYPFHHAALGTFDLFIAPIRQDDQGLYYEAVFNRRSAEGEA